MLSRGFRDFGPGVKISLVLMKRRSRAASFNTEHGQASIMVAKEDRLIPIQRQVIIPLARVDISPRSLHYLMSREPLDLVARKLSPSYHTRSLKTHPINKINCHGSSVGSGRKVVRHFPSKPNIRLGNGRFKSGRLLTFICETKLLDHVIVGNGNLSQ